METSARNVEELAEIKTLLLDFFQILSTKEWSENRQELFSPTYISSIRAMHGAKLGEILPRLEELVGFEQSTIPPVRVQDDSQDAKRYRHRRFIEVTDRLSASGVMAMSPEYLDAALARYDTETDELTGTPVDYDGF